jgi:aerobic-type carbon monoxide dehydrogenase small subunit (CoxS/CutS family)
MTERDEVEVATVAFEVDGRAVEVPAEGTLLDALRGPLAVRSVKDGCSPQGQCGCCTVLVDGAARVSCVTPVRRVAGRSVVTLDGLDPEVRDGWIDAFVACGASQCGFCTPGIVLRLEAQRAASADRPGAIASGRPGSGSSGRPGSGSSGRPGSGSSGRPGSVERALAAHLCRCTGWQTIEEAVEVRGGTASRPVAAAGRDLDAAGRRATLELGAPQRVGPAVVAGAAGFSADTAPEGCLVAVPDPAGGWAVGETLPAARLAAGKVQGRRTSIAATPPLEVPAGEWAASLRTSWVDAAYVETDASWCEPGGEPSPAAANGGAFGSKRESPLPAAARALADEHGRAVLAMWSREDCCRATPKRPPIAAGVRVDGTGIVRVARTPGIADAIAAVAPGLEVVEVDLAGPPTSAAPRAAGWAEAVVLLAGAGADAATVAVEGASVRVAGRGGGWAEAAVLDDVVHVRVDAGDPLDAVVLRSYCIGAAHMATSWVTSESLAVDAEGEVHDLTVRSLGVLPASRTPRIEVAIEDTDGPAVAISDAVFAAVAAAVWRHQGCPPAWPTGRSLGEPS